MVRGYDDGGGVDDDLPDVGDPLIGDGGEFSPGTRLGNKAADIASKFVGGIPLMFTQSTSLISGHRIPIQR
jgi:hypothetical protein